MYIPSINHLLHV